MTYRVALRPAARRQINRLRGPAFLALRGVILALSTDPRPRGAIKLSGSSDLWRLRIRVDGQPWRVVYLIDDRKRSVVVTRVSRRDEGTYRALEAR